MLSTSPQEIDYGTPEQESARSVTLTIDGHCVTVPARTSLLRAATQAGVRVPHLCATDRLKPAGSCRLCLVQIEGRKGFPASCTTPAEDRMVVRTQTPAVQALRQGVMALYLSDHPLDCLTCAANGICELQVQAAAVGMRALPYPAQATRNGLVKDESNPYFTFDPAKCILCQRCVRACAEIQGNFALTITGRGFASRLTAGQDQSFMDSECVSCGACVQLCPTGALQEKTVIEQGPPERSVITTCAYCGVGCGFRAEVKGDAVVRMTPWKAGQANEGHSCLKGRFAWRYVTHKDRISTPMIRESINDPWKIVSLDEALKFAAARIKKVQADYGINAVGGIASSRCTNEETWLMQKLVRTAFGNNNVDNCARVCHAPTGYGLGQALGTSAGTQTFRSVKDADVILVIGANPAEAHPVFGARLKRRVREGARLIVIDPRRIDLVSSPHIRADYHLALKPGTNVAMLNALAHVVVTENWLAETYIQERCEAESFAAWRDFVALPENSPEALATITGVDAANVRAAARLYASGPNAAIYYGLGVTEHAQGSTAVLGIANLAMACGMVGREGVGINPLRGQNNVQGSCDMGCFPHEFPGYRPVTDSATRQLFEQAWGVRLQAEPGLRMPHMFEAAREGKLKALYCQGEDIAQSGPDTQQIKAALLAMDCVVVQDIFLNETARYAHVFLPGSSFLEKDGTFTNAERRISRVRKVIQPLAGLADWEVTMKFATALGYPMHYAHPQEIMQEIAALTPKFQGVNYEKLERLGSVQWPCSAETGEAGTPIMHRDSFARGKGRFFNTLYVPSDEKISARYPLLLTTGRVLTQYNVGTQTRRTANTCWHDEDWLEIHPQDATDRQIHEGDQVLLESRAGRTALRARISERMQPGVVFTSFHFPVSGTNVVTTSSADWATTCPEYKVTAVQVHAVRPSADHVVQPVPADTACRKQ